MIRIYKLKTKTKALQEREIMKETVLRKDSSCCGFFEFEGQTFAFFFFFSIKMPVNTLCYLYTENTFKDSERECHKNVILPKS